MKINFKEKATIGFLISTAISIFGAVLSMTDLIFYNIFLIPLAGAISFLTQAEKSIFSTIYTFVSFYIVVLTYSIIDLVRYSDAFSFNLLLAPLLYCLIALLLHGLGIIIGFCIYTIIKKEYGKIVKVVFSVIGIALISGIFLVSNSFMGNPFMKNSVKTSAQNYIEDNYNNLNLYVDRIFYDFKSLDYCVNVKSNSSIDTHFTIYFDNDKVKYDSYSSVTSKLNTISRFEAETARLVEEKVKAVKNPTGVSVMTTKKVYETIPSIIHIDMEYDKTIPLDYEVIVTYDDVKEIENATKILKSIETEIKKESIPVEYYTLISNQNFTVANATPEMIEREDFDTIVYNARNIVLSGQTENSFYVLESE